MIDLLLKFFILGCTVAYLCLDLYEKRQLILFKVKQLLFKKSYKLKLMNEIQVHDIVQLILKPKGEFFDSVSFSEGIKKLSLVFGSDGFFHKIDEGNSIYTLCHLYPPGTFAFHQLTRASYSGCKFFLAIDAQDFSSQKFDRLMKDATFLADYLDAYLVDEADNPLTKLSIDFIKQKISLKSFYKNLVEY